MGICSRNGYSSRKSLLNLSVSRHLYLAGVALLFSGLLVGCDSGGGMSNEAPSADFSFSPNSPREGETVSFTSNASDPDGSIQSYQWEFGDESSGSGSNPTHTFDSEGSYTVRLTVEDNQGASSSATRTVDVQENRSPSVDFSFSPESPRAGNAVSFTANATDPDGSIQEYRWDFGDGSTASGSSVDYSFDSKGSYSVRLTVEDGQGATSSQTRTVDVRQQFTQVTIEEVVVVDFPFTNDSGQGWDFNSGPDPYFTAYNVTDDVVEASSVSYTNVAPGDLPLSYTNTPFTIEDLSKEYSVNLYDSDSNQDEVIGGVSYTFDNLVGQYPETFTLEFEDITYEVELNWSN